MEELVEKLPAESPRKRNRGWFQPGDRRINREGRPRGSKKATVRAPCSARLKLLFVSKADLTRCLTGEEAFWIENLPWDVDFVGCRPARDGILLTLHSTSFPKVAKGAAIPHFCAVRRHGSKRLKSRQSASAGKTGFA
jgi:hypothetical protein